MKVETKLAMGAVVVCLVLAWLGRYEPLPTAAAAAVLDRWTGAIYLVGADGKLFRATATDE